MNANDIKSDTLTLLLSNQAHKFLPTKQRAIKIAKCCKVVRDRTKDELLYNACRLIIKKVSAGCYYYAIEKMAITEGNYYFEYGEVK